MKKNKEERIITSAEIMKREDRKRIIIVSISLMIAATLAIHIFSVIFINVFPFLRVWFRPTERIKSDVLELMPIGTSWEEVIKIIESKEEWYGDDKHWSSLREYLIQGITERRVVRFSLLNYEHPLIQVTMTLRFDEDLELSEVEVTQLLRI
ncbi:MAG: hypothetical protein FWG70_05345 [Oscillospiraceae bacterium]|nr:hypothetical protein [Oscillospiraceae bacterium]